jgi:branched-subunit amino acid ABC-type transport system permease component
LELSNALVAGLVVGGAYALLALGVSLIFSTTGVLNFAQAAFAMLAAYIYSWGSADQNWAPIVAAVVAVTIATAYGLVVERLVVRRISGSSPATKMMATVAVLAVTQGVVLQLFGFQPKIARRLAPEGSVYLGDLGISYQQILVIVTAAVLVSALAAFLRLTRLGLAVRAAAQNPTGAHLVGIHRNRIARLNWLIGSFLAGVAGVLIAPLTIVSIGTFPGLLLKALAGTLFGALGGLTLAAVGGICVGALESLASTVTDTPGSRELVVLLLVVALLVFRRNWPEDLTAAPSMRDTVSHQALGPGAVLLVGLIAFACLKGLTDPFWGAVGVVALVYTIVSLSLVILVGWGGQLSLMHGALVGVGAFGLTWYLNRFDLPIVLAVLCAGLTGGAIAGLVSVTGLRLRGAQIVIVTLAVSQAGSEWLFQFRGTRWTLERPGSLTDDRWFFAVLLGVTVAFHGLAFLLRRSPWGHMLDATARSETVAQHFGTHTNLVRFQAWTLSGFMAATAGAFYALYLTAIKPSDFGVLLSISLLLYLIACGRSSMFAPALVGLVFVFGPEVFKFSQTGATAIPSIVSGLAVVAVLALFPSGLADLITRWRPSPRRDPSKARIPTSIGPRITAPALARSLRRAEPHQLVRPLKRAEGATR